MKSKSEGIVFMIPNSIEKIMMADEDIDDIMESALFGCTYWCLKAAPDGPYLGRYASEQVSRGGGLLFFPIEEDDYESACLTKEKFRYGVDKWLRSLENVSCVTEDGYIDPGQIDAGMADTIIQYALFDEIRYA